MNKLLWWVVMVDIDNGERSVLETPISTELAALVFEAWAGHDLKQRGAVPMFWPTGHPLPTWLTASA